MGEQVVLRTDHRPLTFIQAGSEVNRKLARWWAYLQEFNYTVEYWPGKINNVPDCLSRLTTGKAGEVDATLEHVSTVLAAKRTTEAFDEPSADDADDGCARCGGGLEDDHLCCAACGGKWHRTCVLSTFPTEGVFWYCGQCCALDARDPAMNGALLLLVAGHEADDVIEAMGVE